MNRAVNDAMHPAVSSYALPSWLTAPSARRALLAVLAVCLALAGCGGERGESRERQERRIAVYYVEDVARGVPRRADELRLVDASPGMLRLARYADGDRDVHGTVPPPQLAARARRWPSLCRGFASGAIVLAPGTGLLAPRPGLIAGDHDPIAALVDAENQDRRLTDLIVISRFEPDPPAAAAWRAALIAARTELDREAGAQLWNDAVPAPSAPPATAASTATHGSASAAATTLAISAPATASMPKNPKKP